MYKTLKDHTAPKLKELFQFDNESITSDTHD